MRSARTLALVAFTAVLWAATRPHEVDADLLSRRAADGWMLLDGDLFTGVSVTRGVDGTVLGRTEYEGGVQSGRVERWHANGTLSYRAHYRDGRRDGTVETWWDDGGRRSRSTYVDGVAHGVQQEWYRSGALFKELRLNQGTQEGLQRAWRENGKLYVNYEAVDGRIFGLKRSQLCFDLDSESALDANFDLETDR